MRLTSMFYVSKHHAMVMGKKDQKTTDKEQRREIHAKLSASMC